jgi:hypothetical protein
MKITINGFVLADSGADTVSGLRLRWSRNVQVGSFIRAGAVALFDRGNQQAVLTFGVTRLHDTVEAAEEFLFRHPAEIPPQGDVKILCKSRPNAPSWKEAVMPSAVVSSGECWFSGRTTFWSYSIVAGNYVVNGVSLVPDYFAQGLAPWVRGARRSTA